jgi:hypothetical protein
VCVRACVGGGGGALGHVVQLVHTALVVAVAGDETYDPVERMHEHQLLRENTVSVLLSEMSC